MTPDDALHVLGLSRPTTWPQVRAAYRQRVQVHHPDRSAAHDAPRLTAELNAAYRVLRDHRDLLEVVPSPATDAVPPAWGPDPAPDAPDVAAADDDSLILVAPHDEVFWRLHAALDVVGDVTLADPDAGLLEALVPGTGPAPSQLVVTLQGRVAGTEAFFTLESLDESTAPSLPELVRELARLVRSIRVWPV